MNVVGSIQRQKYMLEAETLRRCKNMLNVLYHHVKFVGADFACY